MKSLKRVSRRAVTMTELLVVLAIISLLATIAVPVYLSQIQRAKFSVAQAEVRAIAEAEQNVAILHGFYVPIHILDNIPNRQSGTSNTGTSTSLDDFDNLASPASHFLIDAQVPVEDISSADQASLGDTTTRVESLIETWQGPFLNPKRVAYVGADVGTGALGELTHDLVVDPWGNPYRFYTARGLASSAGLPGASQEDVLLTMDDLDIGNGTEVDRFDRFAIVSYGPDGMSDFTNNPLDQGNDIYYTFVGVTPNETVYSGF